MKSDIVINNKKEWMSYDLNNIQSSVSLKIILMVENLNKDNIDKIVSIIIFKNYQNIFLSFEKYIK